MKPQIPQPGSSKSQEPLLPWTFLPSFLVPLTASRSQEETGRRAAVKTLPQLSRGWQLVWVLTVNARRQNEFCVCLWQVLSERKHEILHEGLKHTCTVSTFESIFHQSLIYPSIYHLSIHQSIRLFIICLPISVYPTIYLPIHLSSSYPFLYCLYLVHYLSTLPSLYLSIYLVYLSIYPSYLYIYPSIHLSSMYLSRNV